MSFKAIKGRRLYDFLDIQDMTYGEWEKETIRKNKFKKGLDFVTVDGETVFSFEAAYETACSADSAAARITRLILVFEDY